MLPVACSTMVSTSAANPNLGGVSAPQENSHHRSTNVIPTNNVTTKEGITVRARIDPTLTVDDVIRQLCLSLKLRDPPAMYALRDETEELVTNGNLRKKILAKAHMKCVKLDDGLKRLVSLMPSRLVSAPGLEAADIVEKLSQRDDKTLRLTLFSLQKFIRVRNDSAFIPSC
jgi:engulfment and cell motility protein 1